MKSDNRGTLGKKLARIFLACTLVTLMIPSAALALAEEPAKASQDMPADVSENAAAPEDAAQSAAGPETIAQSAAEPEVVVQSVPEITMQSLVAEGAFGTNCYFTLDDAGVLTISKVNASSPASFLCANSGKGDLYNAVVLQCGEATYKNISRFVVADEMQATGRMSGFFSKRENLTSVDLAKLDMSKIETVENMFDNCKNLTEVNLPSNKDFSSAKSMYYMFIHCEKLKSVDMSNVKAPKVDNTAGMFHSCEELETVNLRGLKAPNNQRTDSMFYKCKNLVSLDLSGVEMNELEDVGNMFYTCENLESIDFSTTLIDTSKSTSFTGLFRGCAKLKNLDLTNLDVSNAEDLRFMFYGCKSLSSLDLSGFDTSKTTNMQMMFYGCESLSCLDLISFDTSKVENMQRMFSGCTNLETIYAPASFTTTSVTDSDGMFADCSKLKGGAGTAYDTSHTDKTGACIDKLDGTTWGANKGYFATIYYTVSFDVQGEGYTPLPQVVAVGSKLEMMPTPISEAYLFGGWYKEPGCINAWNAATDVVTGDMTLYAKWMPYIPMLRLYNPYSGEHFYTANVAEKDGLVAVGWIDEGVGWNAPTSGNAVYRLYNRFGGEHHYTLDATEKNALVNAGWEDEGIGWYSDVNKTVPVYREYNPYAYSNNHNYTPNIDEHNYLVSLGWQDEGKAWYGI